MILRFSLAFFLLVGASFEVLAGAHASESDLLSSEVALSAHYSNQRPRTSEELLRLQISRLFSALNHRDLDTIKSQISPTRIYVEIGGKTGAFLSNSQTLAVMESFLRSHTSVSAKFDFDNADGDNGSASGTLTARRDGHTLTYKLNFGFTRTSRGAWLLTRISMR